MAAIGAVVKAGAAGAASGAAGSAAEHAATKGVRGRRGKRHAGGPAPDRALVAAMAVLFAMGFLRYALVDRTVPPRRWWVGSLVTAAFLSLATDLVPRAARSFSYMVILAAVLQHSIPIFQELDKIDKDAAGNAAPGGQPGQSATTPASATVGNTVLPPVFLRNTNGGVIPSGGAGAQTQRYVETQRTQLVRAKRPTRSTSSPYGTIHL